jgi:hypothetical protein
LTPSAAPWRRTLSPSHIQRPGDEDRRDAVSDVTDTEGVGEETTAAEDELDGEAYIGEPLDAHYLERLSEEAN